MSFPKEIEDIIVAMKNDLDETERIERKIFAAVHVSGITSVASSTEWLDVNEVEDSLLFYLKSCYIIDQNQLKVCVESNKVVYFSNFAEIPFYDPHFALKWAQCIRTVISPLTSLYLDLGEAWHPIPDYVYRFHKKFRSQADTDTIVGRRRSPHYPVENLLYLIDTLSYLRNLSYVFFSNWERGCHSDEDLEKIVNGFKRFVEGFQGQKKCFLRIYTKGESFPFAGLVGLHPLVTISHNDNVWD